MQGMLPGIHMSGARAAVLGGRGCWTARQARPTLLLRLARGSSGSTTSSSTSSSTPTPTPTPTLSPRKASAPPLDLEAALPSNLLLSDPSVLDGSWEEATEYRSGRTLPESLIAEFPVMSFGAGKPEQVDTVALDPFVFRTDVRPDLIARCVRWHLAKWRQGTKKTKRRGEVAYTGKKMYQQKGTGRARHRDRGAPQFSGTGAKAHGPVPRDYEHKINRKERAFALRSALAARLQEGRITVVQDFAAAAAPQEPVQFAEALRHFGYVAFRDEALTPHERVGRFYTALLVDSEVGPDLWAATKGLAGVRVLDGIWTHTHAVTNARHLFLTVSGLRQLEARLMRTATSTVTLSYAERQAYEAERAAQRRAALAALEADS